MLEPLEYFNDPNFVFDPIEHTYVYLNPETKKPVQIFESVSGFISQFPWNIPPSSIAKLETVISPCSDPDCKILNCDSE